jgi:hypothetical protein
VALARNVERVTPGFSLGQEIGHKRLAGEKQEPAIRMLCPQKNRKVDAIHEGKSDVDDGQDYDP